MHKGSFAYCIIISAFAKLMALGQKEGWQPSATNKGLESAGADPGFRAREGGGGGSEKQKIVELIYSPQSRATKCRKPEVYSFICFVLFACI